tara:strand:+ start:399 stop:500 length:102 start_codon:yes stop_codon:yes gene_type:complete
VIGSLLGIDASATGAGNLPSKTRQHIGFKSIAD